MTTLNVIITSEKVSLRDGSASIKYCAVGLEKFLVGEGDTAQAAMIELNRAIISTMLANERFSQEPFFGIKAAPSAYVALQSKGVAMNTLNIQNAVAGHSYEVKPVLVADAA